VSQVCDRRFHRDREGGFQQDREGHIPMNAEAIFDAFIAVVEQLSQEAQRQNRLRQLWNRCRPCCGHCFFWMKSNLCPREINVAGQNRGPSMNGAPCKKFERTKEAREALLVWKHETKRESHRGVFQDTNGPV